MRPSKGASAITIHTPAPPFWYMTEGELGMVVYAAIVFRAPSNAATAVLALLYFSLPFLIITNVVIAGGILVVGSLG